MDPLYLQEIMVQLASAFPEHTVTLVLRHMEDPRFNAVATTDRAPVESTVLLERYVLNNFTPEARH